MEQGDGDGPPLYTMISSDSGTGGHSSHGAPSAPSDQPEIVTAPAPVPPFLFKTYDMVDDAVTNSVLSWSPSGTSFIVWNPQQFCQHLLPRYFKHSNFSSFIRQLNIYGFRKSDPDRWEFANGGFVRGQRHLLFGIRRRTSAANSGSRQNAGALSSRVDQQQQLAPGAHLSIVHQCQHGAVSHCTTPTQSQIALAGAGCSSDFVLAADKQALQEEIEKLKREKSVLMMDVMRLQQQLQSTEQDLQTIWEHLQMTEQRQHHMLSFITQATNISNPVMLINILGQQQHHIRAGQQPNQLPWRPSSCVVSASAKLDESGISNSEKMQSPTSPFVGSIGNSSESNSSAFLHGEAEAIRPPLSHEEEYLHPASAGGTTINPSLPLREHYGPAWNTQPEFSSHYNRLESPPSRPFLIRRENRQFSDTLHLIGKHDLSADHECSYQITTREVSIGASFRPMRHAEMAGASLQDEHAVGSHETASALSIQNVGAYHEALPGQQLGLHQSEEKGLQAFGKRIGEQPSESSLVGFAEPNYEQASLESLFCGSMQGGASGSSNIGWVGSSSSHETSSMHGMLSDLPQQVMEAGSGAEVFGRCTSSILSDSELRLPTHTKSRSSGNGSDFNKDVDSVFWDL